MGPTVFFHAHPDDEAIFTGGTCAMLAARGERPVIVLATNGEGGVPDSTGVADLATHRVAEARAAAEMLGCEVRFLGYGDSGMAGELSGGFAHQPVDGPAERLAAILQEVGAAAIVMYDEHGIYGHPDHIQVYAVGQRAADLAGVETRYLATVDREYLHFVETHVVVTAGEPDHPTDLGLAATSLGMPTVLIDLAIDVRAYLDPKRRAMAAHASQLPPDSQTMTLADADFEAVYGWEWYLRSGPPGPID